MDAKKVENSFSKISENEAWRESFINSMLAFEKEIGRSHIDVREDVSGPLVDSIFDDSKVIRKTLSDGTVLDFYYRSKIARDFVMSEPRVPDHAWEPNTTKLLLDLAAGAKNVVIGGAYFGDQAILIAKKISSISGVVHAFEPNNEQRGMLVHNSQLNNLANIKARNEGLWDNSTTSLTLVGYDSFAHPEAASESDVDAFQTVTIADYMSAAGAEELGLIMLDIEGAELKALKGAESFLSKPVGSAPSVVFEVHKSYMDWSKGLENTEIVKYLSGFGYHVFAVRDFNSNFDLSNQPIELIPCDSVYLEGPDHGFNMVAVKDLSLVSGDNYRMCKNVSPKYLRHKDPALHFPLNGL